MRTDAIYFRSEARAHEGGVVATIIDRLKSIVLPSAQSTPPILRNMEYHLVEHCNLSCKRCGHFSPLAQPEEADPEDFKRDLRQLATRFSNIQRIRLMGGEPTLHSNPMAFVDAAHDVFPNADLRIATNGTRLKAMPEEFWAACRRANVTLDLSLYPVMDKAGPGIEELCSQHGVKLKVFRKHSFFSWINARGDSDPVRAMANCRSHHYCPFLKNSRLYVCVLPAVVGYYNKHFGQSIPDDPGIDIYDPALDGEQIIRRLNTPVETCRFCACAWPMHPWENEPDARIEDYHVHNS